MLEIKILVTDVDYRSIVDAVVPVVAEKLKEKGGILGLVEKGKEPMTVLAHKAIEKKGPDGTEEWVTELAEKKRSFLIEKATGLAREKHVDLQICDISVRKI